MLSLQSYSFKVEHRPGLKHTNADSMTGPPIARDVLWIEDYFEKEIFLSPQQECFVLTRSQAAASTANSEKEQVEEGETAAEIESKKMNRIL